MNTPNHVAVVIAVLLVVGCQQAPPTGRGSFVFVENAPNPTPQRQTTFKPSESSEQVIEAQARSPLIPPEYPPEALRAKVGHVVLPMRVVIGINGLVTQTEIRPGVFPALIPRCDDFVRAIDDAVRRWRFTPARLVVSVPDTPTRTGYTDSHPVEMYFDIDFTFDPSSPVKSTVIRAQ